MDSIRIACNSGTLNFQILRYLTVALGFCFRAAHGLKSLPLMLILGILWFETGAGKAGYHGGVPVAARVFKFIEPGSGRGVRPE